MRSSVKICGRKSFPENAPRVSDFDYRFLAEKLKVAGGNIKNIALSSAFYAANEATVINMNHILLATQREYHKIGKSFLKSDFEPYSELAEEKSMAYYLHIRYGILAIH